jgi:hypothetical protein
MNHYCIRHLGEDITQEPVTDYAYTTSDGIVVHKKNDITQEMDPLFCHTISKDTSYVFYGVYSEDPLDLRGINKYNFHFEEFGKYIVGEVIVIAVDSEYSTIKSLTIEDYASYIGSLSESVSSLTDDSCYSDDDDNDDTFEDASDSDYDSWSSDDS